MDTIDLLSSSIDGRKELFIRVSDSIWDFAETRYEEFKSSELLCGVLSDEGFEVTKGVAGIETAFVAKYGSGKPCIGILGEFDALPGMSQVAGISEKKAAADGGPGHGCGHNSLGTSALAAAIAVKDYITATGIPGSVIYFGCPAEESGSGKVYMVRDGCFSDIDAALTCHPGDANIVMSASFLAVTQVYFKFHGTSAHAAESPHLGRSALDAVELTNVGANYLREHIIQDARLHYAITNAGGPAPNVVQSEAAVVYQIRAPKLPQAREIYDRVVNIAKGAALMTGTTLEIVFDRASSNIIPNRVLEGVLADSFSELGAVPVDEDDIEFAKAIRASFNEKDKKTMPTQIHDKSGEYASAVFDKDVVDIVCPYVPGNTVVPASTDVGDVSWNVPTSQIATVCYAKGTSVHSWQLVAQGKSALFHKGTLHAGKVLALAAVKLLSDPLLVEEAKLELRDRLEGDEYVCPIPPDVTPSLTR